MTSEFISDIAWESLRNAYQTAKPFPYVVMDDFFRPEVAEKLVTEFPSLDSNSWFVYDNQIENKRTSNNWEAFPQTTYQVFTYLNSQEFLNHMEQLTGIHELFPDIGLNGGGWHSHGRGGKLNIHKDYSIHPKLKKERRLNLIVYLTPDWKTEWGGGLELWSHDENLNQPRKKEIEIQNQFNRAVLFDTTQNSWHGLPNELECPQGSARQSIAVYYLTEARKNVDPRGKALFAPREDQKNDQEVLELIKKRSNVNSVGETYRKKK